MSCPQNGDFGASMFPSRLLMYPICQKRTATLLPNSLPKEGPRVCQLVSRVVRLLGSLDV